MLIIHKHIISVQVAKKSNHSEETCQKDIPTSWQELNVYNILLAACVLRLVARVSLVLMGALMKQSGVAIMRNDTFRRRTAVPRRSFA